MATAPYTPKRDMTEYPMEVQKTQRGPELFDECLAELTANDGMPEDAAIYYILNNWPAMVAMMDPGTKMDGPVAQE